MAKHPGGQDILLGVAGRDASVEFETMRHSALAVEQLERRPNRKENEWKIDQNWLETRPFHGFFSIFLAHFSSLFDLFSWLFDGF